MRAESNIKKKDTNEEKQAQIDNSLENQYDKLYDAWERQTQTDLQNSIQLSQRYRHMSDGAIRR